jgi:membrane protein involved in colicin uptake
VRQGRTDAWIAHQLEVTVQQIQAFKREQGLEPDAEDLGIPEEVDLRAEDDAQIAAELEEEAARKAEEEARAAEEAARKAAEAAAEAAAKAAEREEGEGDEEEDKPKRGRRRGGRSRRRTASAGPLEGTFDHGEEGYGLWLDPAIQDDPIYAEHWAGHRPVEISIEEDQIVIRRAGAAEDDDND